MNFDHLRLGPKVRDRLYMSVFEALMEGGVEILMAYKANQRAQRNQL